MLNYTNNNPFGIKNSDKYNLVWCKCWILYYWPI